MTFEQVVGGCLRGAAVGEALGLSYEGLSPARAAKLLGRPERPRLIVGRGMVSDDTEPLWVTAQALIESGGDLEIFQRSLARRLRLWLICLPAGAGLATLKAVIRLWLGVSPQKSGVFFAGNGAAMRASVLGAVLQSREDLKAFVRISSQITHTDPKAEWGAYAVALAARMSSQGKVEGSVYLEQLKEDLGPEAEELIGFLEKAVQSAEAEETTQRFAVQRGLAKGVTGYVYHTVPVVIQAWLSSPQDYRKAVQAVILCGGDADTTAALVGGIVRAGVGREGIPEHWSETLLELQFTPLWLDRLGAQTAKTQTRKGAEKPLAHSVLGTLCRNVLFLGIIAGHGFRRLLLPYA